MAAEKRLDLSQYLKPTLWFEELELGHCSQFADGPFNVAAFLGAEGNYMPNDVKWLRARGIGLGGGFGEALQTSSSSA